MIFAQSNDGVGDPQISGVHHRFENVALPNIRGQSVCTVYLKHQGQEVIVQLWAGLIDVTLFCHCIKKMWEKKNLNSVCHSLCLFFYFLSGHKA